MVLSRLYQPWVFCCIRSQLMDVIINAHRKTIEMQVMNGRSKHERKRERERERTTIKSTLMQYRLIKQVILLFAHNAGFVDAHVLRFAC